MTMNKHTPAPWLVSEAHPHVVIAGEFKYHPHWLGIGSGTEMNANARLIAAAPELLEEMKWVRSNYASGSTKEINARIEAAIAKAEGRDA